MRRQPRREVALTLSRAGDLHRRNRSGIGMAARRHSFDGIPHGSVDGDTRRHWPRIDRLETGASRAIGIDVFTRSAGNRRRHHHLDTGQIATGISTASRA